MKTLQFLLLICTIAATVLGISIVDSLNSTELTILLVCIAILWLAVIFLVDFNELPFAEHFNKEHLID